MLLFSWVAEGQAPESIVATSGTLQRPVYRYPKVAKYVRPDPAQDLTGPNTLELRGHRSRAPHVDGVGWVRDYLMGASSPSGGVGGTVPATLSLLSARRAASAPSRRA